MRFGNFELERKLATGGMAEIFLARQVSAVGLQRHVVVKRILPELASDASFVESFLNEGRLVAQLNHPNVVQIFDLGVVDGSYFMAMEYLRGFDVSTILRVARRQKLEIPLPVGLRIMCDIFAALHYAHSAVNLDGLPLGIVHRDVTPSNVIVTSEGGQAKVVDFGIAKATASDERRTRTGTLKGKLSYLAPEQAQGSTFDHRVDIFAASIVFYELLAGSNPFRGETEYATMRNIVDKVPELVSTIRVDCPSVIADAVHRGMAKDPSARIASGAEMVELIESGAKTAGITLSHTAVQAWLKEHREALTAVAERELGGGELPTLFEDVSQVQAPVSSSGSLSVSLSAPPSARPGTPPAPTPSALASSPLMPASTPLAPAQPPRRAMWHYAAIGAVFGVVAVGAAIWAPVLMGRSRPAGGGAEVSAEGARADASASVPPTSAPVAEVNRVVEVPGGARPNVATGPLGASALSGASTELVEAAQAVHHGGANDKKPPVIKPRASGTLRIAVTPWAEVEIDGKAQGMTPMPPQKLSVGTHKLKLSNPEYGQPVSKTIVISNNKETVVKYDF